jgi:hypothetical protein
MRLLLLFSVALHAQSSIDAPPLAQVLDANGRLTRVFGVAGSFVRGEPDAAAYLAYSFDGVIEWRLEEGRVTVSENGKTFVLPTTETTARFRGRTVDLGASGSYRFDGEQWQPVESPERAILGTGIEYRDRVLVVRHGDGTEEQVSCPREPESMTAAGAAWVSLRIGGQAYLLRVTKGRVKLYLLPERRHP